MCGFKIKNIKQNNFQNEKLNFTVINKKFHFVIFFI